ncbi:MarR family winged helix-turn-helix transcriptional regulator [Candidatus Chloroploca sp. Khr17]|uniref:MarR family winged helix-turn-helix transcriptional regulator n=1 Tax=Candidatus Chloroploca sp. Khr17 TaxID=2496869 RepID=UPI00101C5CA4|nr:MarR family transcriptional regulator [Candidatus Chloroploca sp. Khr17]
MTQVHREQHAEGERTPFDEIERSLMQISWLAQRQFMQLLDDERFRLTVPQFYTLLHLEPLTEACKMSDLAEATHQSAASLTGVVDRLDEKQLIERVRDAKDRRQVMVAVTTYGRELVAEIKQARREQMQMALAHLAETEIEALMLLLDRVLAGMARTLERAEGGRLA